MTYFTPPHRLLSGLWGQSDAEIAAEFGRMIATAECLHFLDCTGKWDRVREWLACLAVRSAGWASPSAWLANGIDGIDWAHLWRWPPPNVVLLARASTQMEYLDRISLRGFGEVGWRTALLLRPVERIELDRALIEAVDQIIVELPPLFKMRPANMALDSARRAAVESIIAQVRAVRRECGRCGGDGWVGEIRELTEDGCPVCTPKGGCGGTGTAPGKPLLWVEGDEAWKERL